MILSSDSLNASVSLFLLVTVNNKDRNYVATKLHFENLKQRYGKLIIILNLLKVDFPRQVKFYTLHLVCGRLSVYLCYL